MEALKIFEGSRKDKMATVTSKGSSDKSYCGSATISRATMSREDSKLSIRRRRARASGQTNHAYQPENRMRSYCCDCGQGGANNLSSPPRNRCAPQRFCASFVLLFALNNKNGRTNRGQVLLGCSWLCRVSGGVQEGSYSPELNFPQSEFVIPFYYTSAIC